VTTRKRATTTGALGAIAEAVEKIADGARDNTSGGSQINVARRTNIKVAKNVGQSDSDANASATQTAPITQQGPSHEATKK